MSVIPLIAEQARAAGASEANSSRSGFQGMRLETGNRQLPAMALYESYGFIRIPLFDEYVNDPTSVCYEKHICPG
jgi:ribosomal protein S18 acetylase RimI-like enzyme